MTTTTTLKDLSLSDLMALYRWFESRGSSENESTYLNMKNFVAIGDEIRKRLSSIEYTESNGRGKK